MWSWSGSTRMRKQKKKKRKTEQRKLWRSARPETVWRSINVPFPSVTFTRFGWNIPMNVPTRNTELFTARYLWIIRSLYSGSIWIWTIPLTWRESCISPRSIRSTIPLKERSSCIIIRYLSQIILRKWFRSSLCCWKVWSTVRICRWMYPEARCRMTAL